MDFKDTLLMPKTDFPMRGNLPNREPDIQKNGRKRISTVLFRNGRKTARNLFYMTDLRMQTATSIWAMHLTRF